MDLGFLKELAMVVIPASLTFWGGVFTGRKRTEAEVERLLSETDTVQIENNDKEMEVYRKFLDDLENRYEKKFQNLSNDAELRVKSIREQAEIIKGMYEERVKILESQNRILRDQSEILERINANLKHENKTLIEQIHKIKNAK